MIYLASIAAVRRVKKIIAILAVVTAAAGAFGCGNFSHEFRDRKRRDLDAVVASLRRKTKGGVQRPAFKNLVADAEVQRGSRD